MRLADAGVAEQQNRHQFEAVLRLETERDLLADVVERVGEVGQRVNQIVDGRHAVRLHAKAQIAGFQHLFVGCAQRLVCAFAEIVQCGLDLVEVVHLTERCHGNFLSDHCCCHCSPRLAGLAGRRRSAPSQVQFNEDRSRRKPAVVRLCC